MPDQPTRGQAADGNAHGELSFRAAPRASRRFLATLTQAIRSTSPTRAIKTFSWMTKCCA